MRKYLNKSAVKGNAITKEPDKVAQIFKVLSDGTRLRIIELLKPRSRCVNALAHELGISPAAVSQHLRILRTSGIVEADKRGYFVHYRVNRQNIAVWRKIAQHVLRLDKKGG